MGKFGLGQGSDISTRGSAGSVLLPAVSFVERPAVKGVVKAGLAVKDMAMDLVADAGEQVSDRYAEAKAEHYSKPEAVNPGTGSLSS